MRFHRVFAVIVASLSLLSGGLGAAEAQCPTLPNQLANGQTTDATLVMADFNALLNCLNAGDLTVPPVTGLAVTGPGGGTATIQNPSATTNYNFNLPAGQLLTSAGTDLLLSGAALNLASTSSARSAASSSARPPPPPTTTTPTATHCFPVPRSPTSAMLVC